MDKQTAVEQVLAAYEKLIGADKRVKALEKKLADGTITMKEGAELNSLRARAFGRAFSGKVLDIAQGEREGACTALLREGCNDVDELAQAAQRAVLARQGLNLTPPTAPFEEERARKIGHSLEDQTVPDETIERRAKSATETMLRSQYDRNMERGAKTCAAAGLKTSIIRDADPGCCKWCSDVAGRYTYGEEPKDVYRRHDNCSCTVVYESGRGRQNVWSKQYWSAEQEREYLRLRDEMKPKPMKGDEVKEQAPLRLSPKQAEALRNKIRSLTFGQKGATIELGEVANYGDDHSRKIQAFLSKAPAEIQKIWSVCVPHFHNGGIIPERDSNGKRNQTSNYFWRRDNVILRADQFPNGPGLPYQTLFHEYGHHADFILNRLYGDGNVSKAYSETYKNGLLGRTAREEAAKAVDRYRMEMVEKQRNGEIARIKKEIENYEFMGMMGFSLDADEILQKQKYEKELQYWETKFSIKSARAPSRKEAEEEYVKELDKIFANVDKSIKGDLSDVLEGSMPFNTATPLGVGHNKEGRSNYWENKDNGKEVFAEIYSASVNNPESLKLIKQYYPETYKVFLEMIGEIP